jgi:heterodisulfide reductase subunit A
VILSKEEIEVEGVVSSVNDELCIGCGVCEEVCDFSAFRLVETSEGKRKAESVAAMCKGCGVCASSCPQKAIEMHHFKDVQLLAAIEAAAAG